MTGCDNQRCEHHAAIVQASVADVMEKTLSIHGLDGFTPLGLNTQMHVCHAEADTGDTEYTSLLNIYKP